MPPSPPRKFLPTKNIKIGPNLVKICIFYRKNSANLNSNLLKSEDNILFGGVAPPKPICGWGQLPPQEKSQFTRLQCKSYAWKLPKTFFYNSYINLTILTYFSCLCHIPPLRVHIYASDDDLILGNL